LIYYCDDVDKKYQQNMLILKQDERCKINKKGDRQGMSKAIRHALTMANFTIDRPAPLEINRKIATMGGGDSHCVKKSTSLCSASVCFFVLPRASKN